MSSELQPYNPTPLDLTRTRTDDWFDVFPSIVKLSEYISETEFVPDAMRRRPAAVAAAILTGRELGLPPMVALRHLYIIKGKVGQSAELMRALIQRAGHEINYVETSDTRCVVTGRRKDEQETTKVQFTAEDARNAGIDLRGYAADKLVARATSRLARRKFADVIMGLPTVDELEDYSTDAHVVELAEAAPVQRRRAPRKPKAAATQPPTAAPTAVDDDTVELLDDPKEPEQEGTWEVVPSDDGKPSGAIPADSEEGQALLDKAYDRSDELTELTDEDQLGLPLNQPEPITAPQLKKLSILLREAGFTDRETKHAFVTEAIGRQIGSAKELTKDEASRVIDILEP